MGGGGNNDILGWCFSWESVLLNLDWLFNAMGKVISTLRAVRKITGDLLTSF